MCAKTNDVSVSNHGSEPEDHSFDRSAQLPINRSEMVRLLQQAIAGSRLPDDLIDDEHLALLCLGEVERLEAGEREELLRQVSATPWASELVAEMSRLGLRRAQPVQDGETMLFRIAQWGCAMAAMMALSIGLWRVLAPPVGANSQPVAIGTHPAQVRDVPQPGPVIGPAIGPAVGPGAHFPEVASPHNAGIHRPGAGNPATTAEAPGQSAVGGTELRPGPVASEIPPPAHLDFRDKLLIGSLAAVAILGMPVIYWLRLRRRAGGAVAADSSD